MTHKRTVRKVSREFQEVQKDNMRAPKIYEDFYLDLEILIHKN